MQENGAGTKRSKRVKKSSNLILIFERKVRSTLSCETVYKKGSVKDSLVCVKANTVNTV